MSELNGLISDKKRLEKKIVDVYSEYCYKYIKKLYSYANNIKSKIREYQSSLVKISEWSDSKINREHNKYLKWVNKKYNYKQSELEDILNKFILYTIRIVINKYNVDLLKQFINFESINLQEFFYKCLKRTARFYYENPKYIENSKFSKEIDNIILSVLHSYIPLQEILSFIEKNKDREDVLYPYDFNKFSDESKSSNTYTIKSIPKKTIVIEKRDHDDKETDKSGLYYISSEQLDNEYYNSDKSVNSNKSKESKDNTKSKHTQDEKHINVPRLKKGFKFTKNKSNINLPKMNEMEENFFSD